MVFFVVFMFGSKVKGEILDKDKNFGRDFFIKKINRRGKEKRKEKTGFSILIIALHFP